MMEGILLIPQLHLFIFIGFNFVLTIILIIQFLAGLWNIIINFYCHKLLNQRPIFNLYLFHHLIVCLIRCLIIFLSCFSLIIFHHCLSIEIFIHFLLLLSTFDLLLIIIGETAHFWDSTINHKSTLYSKCCVIFGMIFNYFIACLFLSIHITINGENPVLIEFCQTKKKGFFSIENNEQSPIPTMITYVLFILIDLLTCSWIYVSYRDINNLKRQRLATVFFHSLIFTKYKTNERVAMVNRSLKRLLVISLFLLSNIFATLPLLTMKIYDLSMNIYVKIIFIYLTILPWMDCLTFLFYDEMKFNGIKIFSKRTILNEHFHRQQRIGRRLSSYRESMTGV